MVGSIRNGASYFAARLDLGWSRCWVDLDVARDTGLAGSQERISEAIASLIQSRNAVQTIFKDDDRSRVWVSSHADRRWVVKRYRAPAWKTRLYHLFRRTPAWQEWCGTRRLAHAGVRVSMPLALVHESGLSNCVQTLILPYVEGESLYHWLVDSSDSRLEVPTCRARQIVARMIGRQIGAMTTAGIINRDLKPSNLIIDSPCEQGETQPCMIDPAGLRRRRPGEAHVCRMLTNFLQATQEPGGVTTREGLICLKELLDADPSIARDTANRLRSVAKQVVSLLDG